MSKCGRVALCLVLALGFSGISRAQDVSAPGQAPHGGSLNVKRHGYEHGYRDGFLWGEYDRAKKAAFGYKKEMFARGDVGYENFMGDRPQYIGGYQTGFRSGYSDGFYQGPGRFAQIYGKPADPQAATDQEDKLDDVYASQGWSMKDVAYDIAYRDGIRDGGGDRLYAADKEPTFHAHYKSANHGYRIEYGAEDEYKVTYRVAYRRGYFDGYQALRASDGTLKFVSAPKVEKSTDTMAIIGWSTNADTVGEVYYTHNGFNYDHAASFRRGAVHRVELKNLKPSTTYKFFVRTRYGGDLSKTSKVAVFTTPSKTNLILFTEEPKIEEITDSSAVITWKTNIDSSGSVLYRTSPTGHSEIADELSISQDHKVTLTKLAAGTTYYFTIWSSPVCITDNGKFTFATKAAAMASSK